MSKPSSTMPTGRRYKNVPVPFFFQEQTAEAFRAMETAADDVLMCSLGKGGTTWCHKILYLLLHGMDAEGNIVDAGGGGGGGGGVSVGSVGQVYPEALSLKHATEPAAPNDMRRQFFGDWGFEDDLCGQPAPRLFSTHLFGPDLLPTALLKEGGQGRLVIVVRNLKDVLTSLHFFRGEAKDGWLGNEHGPGSLARFIHEDSPNAYGSPFAWVKAMDEIAQALSPEGRVHVVYFEALKRALPSEIQRLADFLKLDCTQTKLDAVARAVGFNAMKESKAKAGNGAGMTLSTVLLRKGAIGDWVNHMTPEHWLQFDEAFEKTLGDVELAMPMRHHMYRTMPGLPPKKEDQTIQDDTREYQKFVRVVLKDGNVVRDKAMAGDGKPFIRGLSEFASTIEPAGTAGAEFTAEAGRYHLFVAGTCPWASGVAATRNLLGLQDVIGMDVADGQSGAGWVFQSGSTCSSFADDTGEPFYVHQVYQAADPVVTTRITVPILWDTQTNTIISNDSWSIVKMLATAFAPLGKAKHLDLYPAALAAEHEELHADIKQRLLNGVYRAGIGLLKGAKPEFIANAKQDVNDSLDKAEEILSKQRYLLGGSLTLVDVRLAMCLLRFDCSYLNGFACNGGKGTTGGVLLGGGYPNVCNYLRELAQMDGVFHEWEAIRQYYRWCIGHPGDQPLPDLAPIVASAEAPHDRAEKFSA